MYPCVLPGKGRESLCHLGTNQLTQSRVVYERHLQLQTSLGAIWKGILDLNGKVIIHRKFETSDKASLTSSSPSLLTWNSYSEDAVPSTQSKPTRIYKQDELE